MKISWKWLNEEYFGGKLPSDLEALRPIFKNFTMTSFEIESIEENAGDLLIDVKVTPNRSHDCLSYNGLSKEFALANNLDFGWQKPWSGEIASFPAGEGRELKVVIEDSSLCKRYIGRVIEGVEVKESPAWLRGRLSSIGQRSINNIVDAANYIMWITGQPMHAFDMDKLSGNTIYVRRAKSGEKLTTLDNKEVELNDSILVIADSDSPLAVAGIKGGKRAEVDSNTTNIILESANFHPTSIRKTSRATQIRTDASYRFEHEISPELASLSIDLLADLILSLAKGEETKLGSPVDNYARKPKQYKLGVSLPEVNSILGLKLSSEDLSGIMNKLKKYSHFEWEEIDPIDRLIEIAPKYVGAKYQYRTSITYDAPKLFDCSSFTAFLYSEVGIAIPRISVDQFFFGDHVEEENIKPGDLIFAVGDSAKIYYESVEFLPGLKSEGINHVGLYLGDDRVIHANSKSGCVAIEKYSESESFKNLSGFRRIVRDPREKRFVVTVPKERLDLVSQYGFYKGGSREDLVEEIGRVYGFFNIKSVLPNTEGFHAEVNKVYYVEELIRFILKEAGFSEVYGYSFVASGDEDKHLKLSNPLSGNLSFLRHNLHEGLIERCDFNIRNKDLLDSDSVKIFELGKVFTDQDEELHLALAVEKSKILESAGKELFDKLGVLDVKPIEHDSRYVEYRVLDIVSKLPDKDSYKDIPVLISEGVLYKKYSLFPHISRDIAVFVPNSVSAGEILEAMQSKATNLLVKHKLFDVFTKNFEDGSSKTSYAFRLSFQASDRTLTNDEINKIMNEIGLVLNSKEGWQVR